MNILNKLDDYNVVFQSTGKTDRSAMPIGNGEVGISLWACEDGDLQFYIARTDALTELDRTVKLGKVRISLSPNPFKKNYYHQELILKDGYIEIKAGSDDKKANIKILVSSESPTIYVCRKFEEPTMISARYITWRTDYSEAYKHNGNIKESPDIVENYGKLIPDIPLEQYNDKMVLAPAFVYEKKRNNVESPELYSVYPFRLYGINKPDLNIFS